MNEVPLVYIIILVFNGKKWLGNCLSSVLKTDYPNYKVLAVDNDSNDGSSDFISDSFPKVELIKNEENYGFAEGNNVGIRFALKQGADYIAILNQDTKVDPGWISQIIRVFESDKEVGILSPMQYDYERQNLDDNFKILFDSGTNNGSDSVETKTLIGTSMVFKRSFCQQIGLFDPLFFSYYEDSDLCRRANYFGYKIGIATKSKIYHWHTLLHKEEVSPQMSRLLLRNHFIYCLKNPRKVLIWNFYRYWRLRLIHCVESLGYFRGFISFCWIFIKLSYVFLYIPLITYKKYKEKRFPVYL